jgi:hypothetical protein
LSRLLARIDDTTYEVSIVVDRVLHIGPSNECFLPTAIGVLVRPLRVRIARPYFLIGVVSLKLPRNIQPRRSTGCGNGFVVCDDLSRVIGRKVAAIRRRTRSDVVQFGEVEEPV